MTVPAKARRRSSSPVARPAPGRRPDRRRVWTFVALGIIVAVSLMRTLHLGFPLERDEGEFGYIAQEMLRGFPMYSSAYTQKLPGTYLIYSLFLSIFGQSMVAIHLGLLLANAALMGLIFWALRRTHNGLAGCVGTLVFGLMALAPNVLGFAGHASFFVALFAMAGLVALLHARERDRTGWFLVSGLCFGLVFLMKQSGIFFAPLALLSMTADAFLARPRRHAGFVLHAVAFTAGAVAPFALTAAYYVAIGKFPLFWFWTFQLARDFVGQVGPAGALRNLHDQTMGVMAGFTILWLLALVGLFAMLRDATLGKDRYLYLTFGAASALSIVPGFYFTNQYYIALLPFLAILIGGLAGTVSRGAPTGRRLIESVGVGAIIAIGLLIGIVKYAPYYSGGQSDDAVARWVYRGNPFPESVAIGEYLKAHTTPQDRIAILGSETQILFYAQRRSASRFVNVYFLTADHPRNRDMQREMIRDIESVRPRYVVFVGMAMSWTLRADFPRDIFEWFGTYRRDRYEVEGLVLMPREGGSATYWGADARAQSPTEDFIEILRRVD